MLYSTSHLHATLAAERSRHELSSHAEGLPRVPSVLAHRLKQDFLIVIGKHE
jgi:hypothetical protein